MFRLIGCQWQWQWQIRVHIQIATGDVLSCCYVAFYHLPYLLARSTRRCLGFSLHVCRPRRLERLDRDWDKL